MSTFINTFNDILALNGMSVTQEQALTFEKLYTMLTETNKLYNLTAVTDERGVSGLHFCDSLMALPYIDSCSPEKIIDIGCGAGFPCLPIAIMRPKISVLGVDSTAKKVDFSTNFATQNNLSQFLSISMRAEDLAKTDMRESFDFATARAVARLNILAELCLPFIKVGGYFLAMKGAQGSEELRECREGIKKLGAEVVLVDEKELVLPNERQKRTFILMKKVDKTPSAYPRAYGKIKKCPIK